MAVYERTPGPLSDWQEYPPELLEQMALGAWMTGDEETLHVIDRECTARDELVGKDDSFYFHLGEDEIRNYLRDIKGELITPATDHTELESLTSWAALVGNVSVLKRIEAEARARDNLDDTDSRYFYLAERCGKIVALAEKKQGE